MPDPTPTPAPDSLAPSAPGSVRPPMRDSFAEQWADDLAQHERSSGQVFLGGSALQLLLMMATDRRSIPMLAAPFAVCRVALAAVALAIVAAQRRGWLRGPAAVTAFVLATNAFFAAGSALVTEPAALVEWNMYVAVAGVFWPAVAWMSSVRRAAAVNFAFMVMTTVAWWRFGRVPLAEGLVCGGLFLDFAWIVGPLVTLWRVRTLRAESELRWKLLRKTAEAEERRAELDFLAAHDAMTGLLNRRAGLQFLGHARQRSRRRRTPLTVVYADLDGLKRVNDRHGHAAGDAMILAASVVLCAGVRGSDAVCRVGGDEFLAVLEECTAADAQRVLERWAADVVAFNARGVEPFTLSLSAGVAEWPPDSTLGIEEIIARADEGMFAMKRSGQRERDPAPGRRSAG